ncbi:hypothetical protein QVD99_005484 [Batrachochytrium dendrobatidis]|nr:hypothetical protein QVD99_005484 [Batrachochytrium dendrobatidis]
MFLDDDEIDSLQRLQMRCSVILSSVWNLGLKFLVRSARRRLSDIQIIVLINHNRA